VTEPRTTGKTDTAAEAIAAAIAHLTREAGGTREGGGDAVGATAADVATAAGVAYSTTNKKLRVLKDAGRAESFDSPDKRTLWRLTTAGQASPVSAAPQQTDPAPEPVAEPVSHTMSADDAGTVDGGPDAEAPQTATLQPADNGAPTVEAALTPAGAADPTTGPGTESDLPGDPGPDAELDAEPDAAPADPPGDATTGAAATDGVPPDHTDPTGNADPGDTAQPAEQPATQPATQPAPGPARSPRRTRTQTTTGGDGTSATTRRAGGSLRGAILDVLEANPDRQYKVGELCKAIDEVSAGAGYVKVGAGAVFNAVVKLVGEHRVVQTVERPATFQLATPAATAG